MPKYPLSSNQKSIWNTQKIFPNSPVYNVGGYVIIDELIDLNKFNTAISILINVNEALKIGIEDNVVSCTQHLEPTYSLDRIEFVDYSSAPDLAVHQCKTQMEKDIKQPFDMSGRLFKSVLYKIGSEKYIWYLKIHHIIADGYSFALLFNKLSAIYNDLLFNGGENYQNNFVKKRNYFDFVKEEISYTNSSRYKIDKSYWVNQFKSNPVEKPLANRPNFHSKRMEIVVKRNAFNKIISLCKDHQVKPFHCFLTILHILYDKISGKNNLVIGIPILNRNNADFKNTVGAFFNVLPISLLYDQNSRFIDIVKAVKHQLISAYRHQRFPLNDLLETLNQKASLYDITFSYQKAPYHQFVKSKVQINYLSNSDMYNDLAIHLLEYDEEADLTFLFDYRIGAFSEYEIIHLIAGVNTFINEADTLIGSKESIRFAGEILYKNPISNKTFWENKLSGVIPKSTISSDFNSSVNTLYKNNSVTINLKKDVTKRIAQFNIEHQVTLHATILTALKILLYKYTGEKDTVIGIPVVYTTPIEVDNQMGVYLNILPIRDELNVKESFSKTLVNVNKTLIEAHKNQNYPVDFIARDLGFTPENWASELFDVILIIENNQKKNIKHSNSKKINVSELLELKDKNKLSKNSIIVTLKELDSVLELMVEYNENLYFKEKMLGLVTHLTLIVQQALNNKSMRVCEIELIDEKEKRKLLNYSRPEAEFKIKNTVLEKFSEQVQKTPDRIAVVFENKKLTYKNLDIRSEAVSYYLRKKFNVKTEAKVGMILDRTEQIAITTIGILKAGCAYVAIDNSLPEERKKYMLEDAECKILITETHYASEIKKYWRGKIITLDSIPVADAILPKIKPNPEHCAFVIYTSGSTGLPKGILQTHKCLLNVVMRQVHYGGFETNLNVLQYSSISFDVFIAHELFFALLSGGCLHIINEDMRKDLIALGKYIAEKEIEWLLLPVSALNTIVEVSDDLWQEQIKLKHIVSAGEQLNLSKKLISYLERFPSIHLHNFYGPSETHNASNYTLPDTVKIDIEQPIGRPSVNTWIHILSEDNQLVPVGVPGELYISGAGLANGYINKANLTSERFIPNSYLNNELMYKTGDIGKWLPDGNIKFLGRKDNQVKIRGYRVELGEIENALLKHPKVKQCVVVAPMDHFNRELIGYIVSDEEIRTTELRSFLIKSLPEYMIPGNYLFLEKLPLNSNGKVDRKNLPLPEKGKSIRDYSYCDPRNQTDNILLRMWEDLLQHDNIGIDENFFELGGHSLKVTQLASRIYKELHVKMEISFIFKHPTIREISDDIQTKTPVVFEEILPAPLQKNYDLTSAQRQMWILSQQENAWMAYNIPAAFILDGHVDTTVFRQALLDLVDRHESLRTVFETVDGEPKLRILSKKEIGFELDEVEFTSKMNDFEVIKEMVENEARKVFDPLKGPLLRCKLIALNSKKYVFIFTIHHLISDGWSLKILINELTTLYSGYRSGKNNPLQPLKIHYKDYSCWKNDQLHTERLQPLFKYWENKLSGGVLHLNFPLDKKRPVTKSYQGRTLHFRIDKSLSKRLKTISKENDASLFMTLLATINLILYKYTGQEDITLGTPVSGRNHEGTENQVGFYVNMLALRTQFSGMESFKMLLDKIKETTLEAYEHQEYPFELLTDTLKLNSDRGRSPLFDFGFTWHDSGYSLIPKTIDFITEPLEFEFKTAKADIWFHGHDAGDEIVYSLEYDTDLFNETTINRFIDHYKRILSAVAENTNNALHKYTCVSDHEKNTLEKGFHATVTDYPKKSTIQQVFEKQVAVSPDSIAIVYGDKELDYRSLNMQANQLAHYLRSNYTIQRDECIGIMLERSELMVISILGTLKSGAAYVPIDTSYPPERIAFMLNDAGVKVLITDSASMFTLLDFYTGALFVIDIQVKELQTYSTENPECINSAQDLAYIMYTSGSTGKPKGVMVENKSVLRLVLHTNYVKFSHNDRLLQTGSVAFDAIIFELWGMLLNGGRVYLLGHSSLMEPSSLMKTVKENGITMMWLTSSWFNELCNVSLEIFAGLEWLLVGGDALSAKHINIVRNAYPSLKLVNGYGPTENTTFSICHLIEKEHLDSIPIGTPIANSTVHILDAYMQVVPIGVAGEICVGGDGLARGYLNQEKLTSEKFRNNPFQQKQRIYLTGDLGRWLDDGTIEFIGRKDHQVKIRGYRIEPGEIENALRDISEIEESVVIVKEDKQGMKSLIAYLVSKQELNIAQLRTDLEKRIPSYMIPGEFIKIERLPLTKNAKVDRKALAELEYAQSNAVENYQEPRNEMEAEAVKIWKELLNKEWIGINDNFFELGGDSIRVLRMISEFSKRINLQIQVDDVYKHNTIAELFQYIGQNRNELIEKKKKKDQSKIIVNAELDALKERVLSSMDDAKKENIEDLYPMSDIEKGMIFSSSLLGQGVYHDQLSYQRVFHNFKIDLFKNALEQLIKKHSILRTSFNQSDFETEIQIVHNRIKFVIPYENISYKNEADQKKHIEDYMKYELSFPFEVSSAPLWKLSLFNCGADKIIVVWQFHHAIIDGWSNASFVTELNNLYLQLVGDPFYQVENLKSTYKDYIIKCEIDKKDQSIRDFWKNELLGYSRLDLFTDQDEFKSYTNELDKEDFKLLKICALKMNTTVKIVSLSAYLYMLNILNYENEIVSGLVTNTRPDCEDSDKILGCFLNTIPLRMSIEENIKCRDFVMQVNRKLIELKDKERLSLPVISQIHNENSKHGNPFFDVMFNYIDFHISDSTKDDILIENTEATHAKINFLEHVRTNTLFDFTVNLTGGGYCINLILTKEFKSGFSLKMVSELYFHILRHLIENPQQALNQVKYINTHDTYKLLATFNNTKSEYPKDKTFIHLFEAQVNNTPNAIAAQIGDRKLTYTELNTRSNQLANYLQQKYEVKKGDLVGIMMNRTESLLIALLGILKSGAAYVPIESFYPVERIQYILEETRLQILISDPQNIELCDKLQWEAESLKSCLYIGKPSNADYSVIESATSELWDYIASESVDDITASGWKNSYTGETFSEEDMAEFVTNVFDKITPHLKPTSNVLEIGCGSGLIMFNIFDKVGSYVGTDISQQVLNICSEKIRSRKLNNIKLFNLTAIEIDKLKAQKFDIIIVNSVIQYFPSYEYLRMFLIKVYDLLTDDGILFLGDIRDKSLQVEYYKTLLNISVDADPEIIRKKVEEEELFLDKRFLYDYFNTIPSQAQINISAKQGSIKNELSIFRYDALIRINKLVPTTTSSFAPSKSRAFENFDHTDNVTNLKHSVSPSDLAYIIYTSGSTGKPKGVEIMHQNVSNLLNWGKHTFPSLNKSVLASTSICFDLSIFEIFTTLVSGGIVVLVDNVLEFINLKNREEISLINTVPSAIKSLLENNALTSSLPIINLAGEALKMDLVNRLYNTKNVQTVYNLYGPSETTTYSTYALIEKDSKKCTVGKPVWNTQIYILDTSGRLVPIGIVGEICIGGDGLSRGYFNKPELTRERFVPDPFVEGNRMYKTGDLGRWLPDGNIEFIGRKDDQVKIRGYRIELGEIETILLNYESITEAVVTTKEDEEGNKNLVAYIVGDVDISSLRKYLKNRLSEYMIPSYYVSLKEMPLTSSGKIDKKRLPDPKTVGMEKGVGYVAPRNEVEEKLVDIWTALLKREHIGIKDNFFDLGGHSLKATRLVFEIHKRFEVKVELKELFTASVLENQAILISGKKRITYLAIKQAEIKPNYTLSSSQRRLWILNLFEESNIAYNMPGVYLFEGDLDRASLDRSFETLINRHEILRTIFKEDESGEVKQWIKDEKTLQFSIRYQNLQHDEQRETVNQIIQEELKTPFNLETGPLLRARLLQISKDKYAFIYITHHIISDGWSMRILLKEMLELYDFYSQNKPILLPPLSIQYKDYAEWQQSQLTENNLKNHKEYWLQQFQGEIPVLEMQFDRPRSAMKTYNGGTVKKEFHRITTEELKLLMQKSGATIFMGLLASVNALLYHYTGQGDIILGCPIAGREHADIQNQVGFYVNTLPLRVQFSGEDSYKTLLDNVKQVALKGYEHQIYPFDELVNELKLQRNMSRQALFDVMVVLQNTRIDDQDTSEIRLEHIRISEYEEMENITSKFDLNFNFEESSTGLQLSIEYNSDLFDRETVIRLSDHLELLIKSILIFPERPINEINILSGQEQERLLQFGSPEALFEINTTVIDDLEIQLEMHGDKIAVVYENVRLTYKELNYQSDLIAYHLRKNLNMKTGDQVGLMLDRSEKLAIVTLGILKAGCAYVAIDHLYPEERKLYILNDCKCKVLIVDGDFVNSIAKIWNGEIINVDQFPTEKEKLPKLKLYPGDIAFVIYTSGSTGVPKGILQTHMCLSNVVRRQADYGGFEKGLKILQYSSVGFDVFIAHELFFALLTGGTLYIINEDDRKDLISLGKYIHHHKIEWLLLPVSSLNTIIDVSDHFWLKDIHIKHLVSAGEQLNLSNKFISYLKAHPEIKLHNFYGPSETHNASNYTINSSIEISKIQPIGRPTTNAWMYILSEKKQLVPQGVAGEIYIAGAGLARAYNNQPGLTEQKFISNPFQQGERMYKTGDLGKWLPDGNALFLGRKDDQVKIRGYRVELGEIENALLKFSKIKQCAVIARGEAGNKELVTYLSGDEQFSVSELRKYLLDRLPEYMVPAYFVQLNHLSLNANGKIDKKSLASLAMTAIKANVEFVAPRNRTERKLLSIWQEILEQENPGINDNFFEFGGHSLKATRLLSRIYKTFEVKLNIKDVFLHPTVSELSTLIDQSSVSAYDPIPSLPENEHYELSHAQKRLWITDQLGAGQNGTFNIPCALLLDGNLHVDSFKLAFDLLIKRHESLRTIFIIVNGEPRQKVLKEINFAFEENDIQNEKDNADWLMDSIQKEAARPFDLENGPLLRAQIIRQNEVSHYFLFTMHHIISDGWSLNVLIDEVMILYDAIVKNIPSPLLPLQVQYKDYSEWHKKIQIEEGAHKAYWHKKLSGNLSPLDFPTDYPRPEIKTYNGKTIFFSIDEVELQGLLALCNNQTSLHNALVTLINVFVYKYTHKNDIIIGCDISGRDHPDLENQIGFYVNTLPLRNQIDGDPTFRELLSQVSQTLMEAQQYQAYPFDRLIDELNMNNGFKGVELFNIVVTTQNSEGSMQRLKNVNGLTISSIEIVNNTSKFDLNFIFNHTSVLEVAIEYNIDLFSTETIELMKLRFIQLIKDILTQPDKKIEEISYKLNLEKEEYSAFNVNELF